MRIGLLFKPRLCLSGQIVTEDNNYLNSYYQCKEKEYTDIEGTLTFEVDGSVETRSTTETSPKLELGNFP